MITRWKETELREALATRRGVHLTGVHQCGKTTLAEYISCNAMRHMSLDLQELRKAAVDDPIGFIDRFDGRTLVIDEIQKVPELLDAIKYKVDHDNSKGQYLLTGSSNLRFMKKVRDSLAGRLGTIRLRTLALGEIRGGKGMFLQSAFNREFPSECKPFDKRAAIRAAFHGGYPEALDLNDKARKAWYRDYIADLLLKDVSDVTEIRKLDALQRIAEWLLSYSSKFFDLKTLCTIAQISRETADGYLNALKALYLFDSVPAWTKSDYSKIGKRAKYFAGDSGLVSNLLGWNEDRIYVDSAACGKLMETWVYHEIAVMAELDSNLTVSQYRDSDKHEIDFIVERADSDIVGIEVKAGVNVGKEDFRHLKWFAANLAKSTFTGIVLYTGSVVLRFGEGFYAVPMSMLTI